MRTRLSMITITLLIIITACSPATPEPTPTNTLEPTSPPTFTPTSTPQPSNTPTVTPTPTRTPQPTAIVPPACTHDLTFIADLSIPDGTPLQLGDTVTKTWRVRNDGTCAWNSNYTFRQIGGTQLTASSIASPVVGGGQIVDLSVTIQVTTTAPQTEGLYRATFRMFTPSGVPFGDSPYVEAALPGVEPPTTGCTRRLSIITAPDAIELTADEIQPVSWTVRNIGTCASSYTIERSGSGSPLTATNLPLEIPSLNPQQTYTFTLNVFLGGGDYGPGFYNMTLQIMDSTDLEASTPINYLAEFISNTASCNWDSDFVEDVTIPDGTVINVGQAFSKTWRLRNSGDCAWNAFDFIKIEDTRNAFEIQSAGFADGVGVPFVAPGETVDITVTFILRNLSPGETARATFQIQRPTGTFFGTSPYIEVQAGN